MGGQGGTFIDRGTIDDIDNAVKTGGYKTNTLYEFVYVLTANRGVLQIRLSPDGTISVRGNRDYMYLNWGAWVTL